MRSNKLVGVLMIVVGLLLTGGGFVILSRLDSEPTSTKSGLEPQPIAAKSTAKPQPIDSTPNPQEDLTSEEKGRKFEEYVVRKFSPNFFTVKEWRGDKVAAGIRAESSMNPDLEIEFRLKDERTMFAIECKWRRSFDQGEKPGINWATEAQIARYNDFQKKRNMPVFVVLGIGGEPDNPGSLYIVNLDRLKFPRANQEYLSKFRRGSTVSDFYYDSKRPELK